MRDSATHSAVAYRPEVDGLRALAVIPVVLFHAGFSWISGGYVGVDVFFVISGYLITSIILTEQAQQRFTIAGFYERRARRILPALFLVLLACLPFALWWMTPHHLKSFSQGMVATTVFAPNVYFYLKSGYFEPDADENPLLHTWSLGVEEQYYIVFPWLVIMCLRLSPRVLTSVIAVTAVVSLVASEWASRFHPIGNFYLAPTRAWELALGSLLAIASIHGFPRARLSVASRNILTVGALAMIIAPMFIYQQATRFPGLYALPPTLGAAAVIAFARDDTFVGRLLSWRWIVGIGLISYSLYLWHQPLFAFARLHSTSRPGPVLSGALSAASIILAYATWRFVEKPFRNRRRFNRRQIFALAIAGSMAFCTAGLIGHFADGLPERLTPDQQRILAYGDRPENQVEGFPGGDCFLTPEHGAAALGQCVENSEATGGSVLLWGDSNAAHLYAGLSRKFAGAVKFTYLTVSSCPPVVRSERLPGRATCREANEEIMARIIRERPDRVVLAAVWGNYSGWKQIASTIRALKEAGIAHIEVVGPVPRWLPSLPVVMARFGLRFEDLPVRSTIGLDPSVRLLDAEMREFCEGLGVTYVSPYASLCNDDGCVIRTGQEIESMIQWDVSHLTKRGSEYLVARLWP